MNKPEKLLFETPVKHFTLPPLEHSWIEDAYDEMELIGFPLCNPFDLLAEHPREEFMSHDLPSNIGNTVTGRWLPRYLSSNAHIEGRTHVLRKFY